MNTAADMRACVEQALAERRDGTALPFATVERATGTVIGSTRFGSAVPAHKRIEIGWTWIAPRRQRTAAHTEAKLMMPGHAFERLGCCRVELETAAVNARSRAAICEWAAPKKARCASTW